MRKTQKPREKDEETGAATTSSVATAPVENSVEVVTSLSNETPDVVASAVVQAATNEVIMQENGEVVMEAP